MSNVNRIVNDVSFLAKKDSQCRLFHRQRIVSLDIRFLRLIE